MPDLGDFKDVEVIEVLVKEGDTVALESPLVTLETDKATMDVPSSAAGTITKLHVARGGRVNAGDVVATVKGEAPATPAAQPTDPDPATPASASAPAPAPRRPRRPRPPTRRCRVAGASAARTRAPRCGASRASLASTSRGSPAAASRAASAKTTSRRSSRRPLTGPPRADSAGAALPRVPDVDFAAFGPVEVKPLGRIQKISGTRLQAAWVNIPHVTQYDEADITELEKLRASLKDRAASRGIKLTPLAFIARACVRVIAQFPNFNASLDAGGQNLVLKKYLHLGFAADTPNGLVVPVIRDAGRKDVYELARDLAELAGKARAGKLAAAEMQGGCFTISSLGGIGGTAFTPIINAPEVAILGVSRSQQRPVWKDGKFEPRLMLPLSLSYDHRVIDGAEAVRFVVALAEALAAPAGLTEAVP